MLALLLALFGVVFGPYADVNRRLLIHELAHVAQYERFDGFRRFLFQYLQECINPGYPLGDLELEAKRTEQSEW